MKRSNASGAVGLLAWALAGCASMSGGQIEQRADEDLRADTSTTNATGGRQQFATDTRRDPYRCLEARGCPARRGELLTLEPVTWADGSLGCPEPGMMYTQALVRGYRIRVDAAGTPMTYHTGATSTFVLCPPERAQEPSPVDPT